MLYALKNRDEADFVIAYVILDEKKYKNDVVIVGNPFLKKQLDIGVSIRPQLHPQASKLSDRKVIKRSDPDCAKLFHELYIPNISGQDNYEFFELDKIPLEIESQLKLKNQAPLSKSSSGLQKSSE